MHGGHIITRFCKFSNSSKYGEAETDFSEACLTKAGDEDLKSLGDRAVLQKWQSLHE